MVKVRKPILKSSTYTPYFLMFFSSKKECVCCLLLIYFFGSHLLFTIPAFFGNEIELKMIEKFKLQQHVIKANNGSLKWLQ